MSFVDVKFSPGEELANTISAAAGVVLSIVALWAMTALVAGQGGMYIASAVVFGASLIALYLASSLNHGVRPGPTKDFFHNVDQAAIYVLIAGSYTPYMLIALHNRTGYMILAAAWACALIGSGRKLLAPNDYETGVDKISVASYVAMGWLGMLAPMEMIEAVPTPGLVWLMVGGVFYTGGLVFFRMKTLRYHHLIWHLCVIGGSVCHVISIYGYVLPIAPP